MKKTFLTFLTFCLLASNLLAQNSIQKGEEDFYTGSHAPNADYILSGGLIKDLPPLPKVEYNYEGKGFEAERLSAVPKTGVHPRVIMSPSDINRMKEMMAMGDKAPLFFKLQLEGLRRNAKDWEVPENFGYYANPFGSDGNIAQWALYALLTNNEELGKKAAKAAVVHALYLEPRLDILNTEEYNDFNKISYDFCRTELRFGPYDYEQAYYMGGREKVFELKENYGVECFFYHTPGSYLTLGWEYDYAYNFMTDEQREIVRRVISKVTYGKYDTGMAIPGQMYINNHMSAGANWIALALSIEGEKGYDERILPIAKWSLENKLSYDLSTDGLTYENTKGYIPMLPVLAVSRRYDGLLLKHSHLLSRANSDVKNARKLYNRYIPRNRIRPNTPTLSEIKTGYDEPRFWRTTAGSGNGGHVEFWSIMKYFYPNDKKIDFVFNVKNSIFNADCYKGDSTDAYNGHLHKSWFELPGVNLLTASHNTDYNHVKELTQFENEAGFWYDKERGMVSFRNGWDDDAMLVHMENRVDQYYAGHETPQHGDFQVWADGIPWSPNVGAYRDASYRALVTVDGLAGVYQPVSGDWMTARDSEEAATSATEMTTAYGWRKYEKLLELDHPTLEQAPHISGRFKEAAYKLDRFTELPFQPQIKNHYDGYGHRDYGPWHGETRGVERYGRWANNMDHVFRTIHFARGENPYLLIFDDLKKDDNPHQFDWRMPVTGDAYVYEINPAAQNRHLELNTEGAIGTDIILAMANSSVKRGQAPVWVNTYPIMKPEPKKGEPMLLVRVLWRNTNFPYPVPNVQKSWGYNMVSIPAHAVSPDYKVMVYPYRFGEKLPTTTWSDDMSQLTVTTKENTDVYLFDKTDKERTVYSMTRNGESVIDSKARPAKPKIIEKGKWTIDHNRPEWRADRLFANNETIMFESQAPGARIYYTLDGSEPNKKSKQVRGEIKITESCTLKARVFQENWYCGEKWSPVAYFKFNNVTPENAENPSNLSEGISAKVYEIKTTIYDKKGFFQGSKKSIPNVDLYEPNVTTTKANFEIPYAEAQTPAKMMAKAFYVFEGYYDALKDGVYRFELESCGPIDFKIGNSQVILVDEQYGLSYKKRYGEVVLKKGKHKLDLLLCDIMFWKGDIEKPYDINVNVKRPGGNDYTAVKDSELSSNVPSQLSNSESSDKGKNVEIARGKSIQMDVCQGINLKKYNRIDLLPADGLIPADGISVEYFDLSKATPYSDVFLNTMKSNDSPRKLMVYSTFIDIASDGVYEFDLFDGVNSCAQLLIDDVVVKKKRVSRSAPSGKIFLESGMHKLQLQLALGKALVYMKNPGASEFQQLSVSSFNWGNTPDVLITGNKEVSNDIEIFEKSLLSFSTDIPGAEIRYSFKHKKLNKIYSKAVSIDKTTKINIALFKENRIYGAVRTLTISKNSIPQKSLIAYLPCEEIKDGMTSMKNSGAANTVVEGGEVVKGKHGNAIGFYKEVSEAVVSGMSALEDAATVSMWVKYKEKSDVMFLTGLPYQYEEYVLWNQGNSFFAEFSRGIGKVNVPVKQEEIATGNWFHIAATYGDENRIYLNGELIVSGQVHNKNVRRGSGRAPKIDLMVSRRGITNAAMDECRIYDRVLSAKEIKVIYEAEK